MADDSKCIVIRQQVQPESDYHRYRDHLRWDFWFSCAYCSIAESEATGIGFVIDHYEPQVRRADLVTDYGNLMYACATCNGKKGDEPDANLTAKGYRFIRPDQEDPREHLRLTGQRVEGTTKTVGEFTVEVLHLNSQHLRRLRRIRESLATSADEILVGIRALERFRMDQVRNQKRRAQFVGIRTRFGEQADKLGQCLGDLVSLREFNRSELLESDPGARDATKARRQYLRELHVLSTDPWRSHGK